MKEKNKGKLKKAKKVQSAAALLMTIMVISIFSLASLAIGRVLSSEVKLTGSYKNKEKAYWAAEAGIEKGLLKYKKDHREVPELPDGAAEDNNTYQRINLTNNGDEGPINDVLVDPPTGEEQVFDYRIWDKISLPTGVSNAQVRQIEKDEGMTYRIVENLNIFIDWEVVDSNGDPISNIGDSFIYVRRNQIDTSRGQPVFETITDDDTSANISVSGLTPNGVTRDKTLQIKAFIDDSLIDAKINFKIVPTQSNKYIGGPYIHIESIGYWQGTGKRLMVKIDRENQNVFNSLDYVIFSGSGLP